MKKLKLIQKNHFIKLSLLGLLAVILSAFNGCAELNDPGYNNSNPYDYGNPNYGRRGNGYDDRYDRDRYGRDRDRYNYDHDRYDHNNDYYHHDYDNHPRNRDHEDNHHEAPPPPPPRIEEQVIRPNCPSGTTFDGRHCILPENKRRPGGKGTINACPNGMWLSGDHCVKN